MTSPGTAHASPSGWQWGCLPTVSGQLAFAVVQGAGRPDLTAKFHLVELPIYLIALTVLVRHYGIEGAAIAWTLRVALDTDPVVRLLYGTRSSLKGLLGLPRTRSVILEC